MTEFQAGRIKYPQTRIQNAISILEQVAGSLAGQFSVEHLEAAEPWHDRFDCLKWAIENEATVSEMVCWHRAQNGLDLFDPYETPAEPAPAPPAPPPFLKT